MTYANDGETETRKDPGMSSWYSPAKVNCPLTSIAGLARLTGTDPSSTSGKVAWLFHTKYGKKREYITEKGKVFGSKIQHPGVVVAEWRHGSYKSPSYGAGQIKGIQWAMQHLLKLSPKVLWLQKSELEEYEHKDVTLITGPKDKWKKQLHGTFRYGYRVGCLRLAGHWFNAIFDRKKRKMEYFDFQCHHRSAEINKHFKPRTFPRRDWTEGARPIRSDDGLVQKFPFVYGSVAKIHRPSVE